MNNIGKIGPYGKFISVPNKIMIYSLGSRLRLEYLAEKQDSYQCVIISLSGQYVTNKDYRIRFMDTQGNPLDKDIESDLDYITADIKFNYKGVIEPIEIEQFKHYFYKEMMDTLVGTALKRKIELLDFFDPQVWKDSEKEIPVDKMQVLNEVREKRIAEEDERAKYINIGDIPYSSTKEVEKLMEYRKSNVTKI